MKRIAVLLIFAAMIVQAACASALTMAGLETDIVSRQWETNAFFTRMQALTGIETRAHGISEQKEYDELIESMLKGRVEYDALFKADLSREQEYALVDSGAIIDLAPHIDAYMPRLSALFRENPQWKKIVTLEDGRIASLPLINTQERQAVMWLNAAWLERLGLEQPRTIEELTSVLEAFRDGDPNGNGRKDELPLDLLGVYEMRWLLPYFGIVADDYHLARDAQGEIVFAPELPAYRTFIAQLKAWYDAGLLRRDAFTAMHSTAVQSQDEDETVCSGMMLSMTPYTHVPVSAVREYVPLLLAGPDGVVRWRDLLGDVWTGCFAVTKACQDVPSALRWADELYGESGAMLAYAGVENEDYVVTDDGTWSFVLDGRRDINAIRSGVVIYTGTSAPGLYPAEFIRRVDSAADRHVFEASEAVHAVSEQVTHAYALSRAAQAQADELAAVLGAGVDKGIARFVTGEIPLDDEHYEAWLEELRSCGGEALTALFAQTEQP